MCFLEFYMFKSFYLNKKFAIYAYGVLAVLILFIYTQIALTVALNEWYRDFYDILQAYNETKQRNDLYGLCFLKYDLKGNDIGNLFQKDETTMFDLYFKERGNWRKSNCIFCQYSKTISL